MNTIKSCGFNMDTACVDVVFGNGSTLSIYTPLIEESMRTTIYSRSRLDWLIDNEPLEYASMVIYGTVQNYLDDIDGIGCKKLQDYAERLSAKLPPNIVEDISREMLMYEN